MNRVLIALIGLLLLGVCGNGFAAVIFDNGNHINNGRVCNWGLLAADNFVLGEGANVVTAVFGQAISPTAGRAWATPTAWPLHWATWAFNRMRASRLLTAQPRM